MLNVLQAALNTLSGQLPLTSTAAYTEHAYPLERAVEQAVDLGVDSTKIEGAILALRAVQGGVWVATLLKRLAGVETGGDANEHDMNKLRKILEDGEVLSIDPSLLTQGRGLLKRLDAELQMSRALLMFPSIRLPVDPAPEGYYLPEDFGHVQETEGYPLPPEGGDYIWVPAQSLTALTEALNRLKNAMNGAESSGANADIVSKSKEQMTKGEKEAKLLEAKDEKDKLGALEAVKKLAKKLKAKKKKEKAAK
ncbi:hypothetical protein EON65_37040 [archaeon]|nr:MAG: hypothetical protein EON65_37040 [archaeon]